MESVRHQREDHLELVVAGRLDGYWAQHLTTSVGDVMREGTHVVRLNLESATYISSAGIGALVDLHKQFTAVNGSFLVTNPSRAVSKVLAIAGGAASQPTDGTNFPDYMLGSGTFVPRLSALYGLCCDGGFSKLVRFESADRVGLSAIADVCLDVAGATTACVVMLAESAG